MSWYATVPGKRGNKANCMFWVLLPEGHQLYSLPRLHQPAHFPSWTAVLVCWTTNPTVSRPIAITVPWVTSLTQHPPWPDLCCHHLLWQQGRGPWVCSSNPLSFQLQPLEMVLRWKISWMIRIVGISRHRRRKGMINIGAWQFGSRVRARLQERGPFFLKFQFHGRAPSVSNKLSGSKV